MTYSIKIQHIPGFSFTAEEGETLLQAAERQGISFPVGCENGLCGTCKGQLITGNITYGSQEIFGLTPEEQENNDILFCSAIPESDCMIEHSGIEIPAQHYREKANVIERKSLTDTLTQLSLATETPWIYKAGQYLNVLLPDSSVEKIPFSIANAPFQDTLKLHVQILKGQALEASLQKLIHAETLEIEGPLGKAYLRNGSRPLLLVAGGSGFAPMNAILESVLKETPHREVYLYWGARKPEFLYAHAMLEEKAKNDPKFHYIPVISEPEHSPDWSGKIGLVHEAVMESHEALMAFECYLAGPLAMIQAAKAAFTQKGLSPRLTYSDMG